MIVLMKIRIACIYGISGVCVLSIAHHHLAQQKGLAFLQLVVEV